MLKRYFSADESYKEDISRYTASDGVCALALYTFMTLVYYFMGVLFVERRIYLGVQVNISLIIICVLLAFARGQKPASIGITLRNIRKSLLTGAIFGGIFSFFLNVLPNILAGGRIIPASQAIYNVFYYFIVIALTEEIVFRGYIQTRIYGLIKNALLAKSVVGLLFYAMHLPFQMPVNGMRIDLLNMAVMIALHFVMNFLYEKYNSIAAPAVFHGLLDWGGNLFRRL